MKRLTMVRHGETELNKQGLLQGQTDIPLNNSGRMQAKQVAEVLKSESFDAIWSSPLSRAKETAHQINKAHQRLIVEKELLKERSFGDYEGRPISELIVSEKQTTQPLTQFKIANGESLDDLCARTRMLTLELKQQEQLHTLLVVGHAGTLRALIGELLNWPLEKWFSISQHNTCINTFVFDDQHNVIAYTLDEHEHCFIE